MNLDGMQSVAIEAFKKGIAMTHEPDDQLALHLHAGIDGRVLDVLGFTVLFKDEINLWMGLSSGIQLTGTGSERFSTRVSGLGSEDAGYQAGKGDDRFHKHGLRDKKNAGL
jgi:hypothetical protein